MKKHLKTPHNTLNHIGRSYAINLMCFCGFLRKSIFHPQVWTFFNIDVGATPNQIRNFTVFKLGPGFENFQIAQKSSKTTPNGSKTCFNMFLSVFGIIWYHFGAFWALLKIFDIFTVTRKMASKNALNRLYLEKYKELGAQTLANEYSILVNIM